MSEKIPLSIPWIHGNEWKYVKECLDTGWVSSAGKFVDEFEKSICRYTQAQHAVGLSSGTAALHIALQVIGTQPDDEVIVPTVTFIATVNAVKYTHGIPVFMDCDDYYNIDLEKTIDFINKETVYRDGYSYNRITNHRVIAIIPVHVLGNAVNLDLLLELCQQRNIKIIEDATESLGTYYSQGALDGRHTGTVGDIGCYSFNGNKIITTGGGGMLVTNNYDYAQRARYLATQSKDDDIYYVHDELGYNYRLNNIQSAIGTAQLETIDEAIERKKVNYLLYKSNIDRIDGFHLAGVPVYAQQNYWMYALQFDAELLDVTREELIEYFLSLGVEVRALWHLNHLQKPYGQCQAYQIKKAPVLMSNTIHLPCSINLRQKEVLQIVDLLKKWVQQRLLVQP